MTGDIFFSHCQLSHFDQFGVAWIVQSPDEAMERRGVEVFHYCDTCH